MEQTFPELAAISKEEIRDLFINEMQDENFDRLFNLEYYTFFSLAGRSKGWLEYLGFSHDRENYKKSLHVINEYMNANFSGVKDFFRSVAPNELMLQMSISSFYFNFEDKTEIFKGDSFNKQFAKESDLQRVIFENVKDMNHKWEVKKERRVTNGICDVLITYEDGSKTAVELKKGVAKRKDVYQAFEYQGNGIEAVLVAKKIPEDVLILAHQLGVGCYEYSLEESDIPVIMVLDKIVSKPDFKFDRVIELSWESDNFYIRYPFAKDLKELNKFISKQLDREINLVENIERIVDQYVIDNKRGTN